MKKRPLVSIIIPTYNRKEKLIRALRSVINQTYQNWECIVVDDYSTDGTAEYCADIISNDSRIKYFQNDYSKGGPEARNYGINRSAGEFLFFMDSDDLLPKSSLKDLTENNSFDNYDIIIGNETHLIFGKYFYTNIDPHINSLQRFFTIFFYNDVPWVHGLLIRKKLIDLYNIRWCKNFKRLQDIQFHIDLLLHNPKILFVEKITYIWVDDGDDSRVSKVILDSDRINLINFFINKYSSVEDKMIKKLIIIQIIKETTTSRKYHSENPIINLKLGGLPKKWQATIKLTNLFTEGIINLPLKPTLPYKVIHQLSRLFTFLLFGRYKNKPSKFARIPVPIEVQKTIEI